jgi:hypothetical protein
MRLAWCHSTVHRPTPASQSVLDDTAALIAELRARHDITAFDRASVHDLVRLDFRQPFDICVYELADTEDSAFLWPYAMHYPGVVRLRSASLHQSRASSLARQRRGRDRDAELAFGRGDLTASAIAASRSIVVADAYQAAALQRDYPEARVRVAPIGIPDRRAHEQPNTATASGIVRVGVLAHPLRQTIVEAIDRARGAGARVGVVREFVPERMLDAADIVLFLPWPPSDDLTPAIAALAAGRPVVMFETSGSAGWPSLDPQTWLPRGFGHSDAPIAIALDPRDETHSLARALRRLATDATLRRELGLAAREWWQRHSTVAHAVDAWVDILQETAAIAPPPRPHGWPRHLTADGTDRAREWLAPFGVSVDFLEPTESS